MVPVVVVPVVVVVVPVVVVVDDTVVIVFATIMLFWFFNPRTPPYQGKTIQRLSGEEERKCY